MSLVPQTIKVGQSSQNKEVLCNPQVSLTNSIEFIKKLSIITISNIAHMRGVFNNDAFIDCELNELMTVKVVHTRADNTNIHTFIQWLKEAFYLLEKRKLRKMVFEISDTKVGNSSNYELYTLNYNYNDETILLDIANNMDEDIVFSSQSTGPPEIIVHQTRKLLSNLMLMTKDLPILSNEHSIRLLLVLKEDALSGFCPPDSFSFADREDIDLIGKDSISKLKLGKVTTQYHSLGVTYKKKFVDENEIISSQILEKEVEVDSDITVNCENVPPVRDATTNNTGCQLLQNTLESKCTESSQKTSDSKTISDIVPASNPLIIKGKLGR